MAIGDEIRRLRLERGLTQKQLAEKIGVTPAAVGNYECGVSFPKEEKLMALFAALECTPNELLAGDSIDPSARDVVSHTRDYERLDKEGRSRVDSVTERELERCLEEEKEERLAARGGKSPRAGKARLSPKRGKNILEAPDYRGK